MRDYLPPTLLTPLRTARKRFRRLQKSFTNAVGAFRPDELGYRLAIGEFRGLQVAYRQGTVDERVILQNLTNEILFSGVPEYQPTPEDIIIDVGAHIGAFSVLAATKVPRGKVFAVEASQETYNYLRVNIALNRLENIEPSHLAISDRRGQTILYHDHASWGHSIVNRMSGRGEEVTTDTLPGYLTQKRIERCDFIKFNCEGSEFPILLHTPPEVLRHIARILVLYHCDIAAGYELDTLIGYLRDSGFHVDVRNQREKRGWIYAQQEG